MRERVDAVPPVEQSFELYSKYVPTGAQTYWGTSVFNTRALYARIRDEMKTRYVSYGNRVRRKAFKVVTHDKWSASYGGSAGWLYSTVDHKYMEHLHPLDVIERGVLVGANHPYTPSLGDWAYAGALSKALAEDYGHYNRWSQLKPSMATRAGLSVFLAELRDFTRMWDFIPKKHLLIKGALGGTLTWGTLRKWRSSFTGDPTQFAAYLNGQHLNYNFGWKPFISDIRKCWRGLESFEERLHRFTRDAGKELRKRFRDSPRQVSETFESTCAGWTRYTLQQIWDVREQHASAFDFSYTIPQYSEEEMRWRALADTLGAKLTPSVFWALTPWSFVVDWFVNVGGFLQSYENDWLQPWIVLHQGCYSRKLTGTYKVNIKQQPAYGSGTFPGITMDFSQYIRKVGLPNFSAVTDPLDADKIRLGTSLLLSLFIR